MRAFVGLISRPVKVETVSTDAITFSDQAAHAPGVIMTIEMSDSSGSVVRLAQIQIAQVTPQPDGASRVEGRFLKQLNDDDLQALRL
jgi:hypothetical protein